MNQRATVYHPEWVVRAKRFEGMLRARATPVGGLHGFSVEVLASASWEAWFLAE